MRYLIKKAKIVTPEKSSQKKDILIENGKIKEISRNIEDSKAQLIESKNLHVCIGFCDIGTQIGEPGFEERETVETVISSALNGGYTCLAPFPNLDPVVDTKSTVKYMINEFEGSPVKVYPIGSISKHCDGKDISEMVDMHHNGAIAFSDDKGKLEDAGLLTRALDYTKSFDGVVCSFPIDDSMARHGQVNEGNASLKTGLKPIPAVSESIRLQRDISLLEYTGGRLHVHAISTALSVELVKQAKRKGLAITEFQRLERSDPCQQKPKGHPVNMNPSPKHHLDRLA